MMNKEYSQEHFDFIKNNYLTMTNVKLGETLGVNSNIIKHQLIKLGLKRPLQININKNPNKKTMGLTLELNKYLIKKKKDFGVSNVDKVIRKIIKEWIAFKRIEHERKSTTNNNINTQAH